MLYSLEHSCSDMIIHALHHIADIMHIITKKKNVSMHPPHICTQTNTPLWQKKKKNACLRQGWVFDVIQTFWFKAVDSPDLKEMLFF